MKTTCMALAILVATTSAYANTDNNKLQITGEIARKIVKDQERTCLHPDLMMDFYNSYIYKDSILIYDLDMSTSTAYTQLSTNDFKELTESAIAAFKTFGEPQCKFLVTGVFELEDKTVRVEAIEQIAFELEDESKMIQDSESEYVFGLVDGEIKLIKYTGDFVLEYTDQNTKGL